VYGNTDIETPGGELRYIQIKNKIHVFSPITNKNFAYNPKEGFDDEGQSIDRDFYVSAAYP